MITAFALLARMFLRVKSSFLPPDPEPLRVSVRDGQNAITGRFSLLAVTTLEKLLLSGEVSGRRQGSLKLLAVEERPMSLIRGFLASAVGRLGRTPLRGVHFEEADEITIHGERSNVILDGETFRAETRPADQPHARATSVFREARGLNAPACPNFARSSRRSSACPSMRG